MPLDDFDSRIFHIGSCVPIPDPAYPAGSITVLSEALQVDSNDSEDKTRLIRVHQEVSPKVIVSAFVRSEDICAILTDHEWHYGKVAIGKKLKQGIGGAFSGTIYVSKGAPVLLRQDIATSAGDDIVSAFGRTFEIRCCGSGGETGP
jgi:hypothetical protein